METSLDKQCTGHPHAENMKLYAEDAMKTNEPWELWEVCMRGEWGLCLITLSGLQAGNTAANPGQSI